MKRSEYQELMRNIADLRAKKLSVEGEMVPESAVFLRDKLASIADPGDRAVLHEMLCDEYALSGLNHKELEAMRARAREYPDEPVPWAGLAARLSHEEGMLEEAQQASDHAVSVAKKSDRFVRYALITRARLAAVQHDWHLLNATLQDLIEDASNERAEDIGYESDFLHGAEGHLDKAIMDRYRTIARR
jgi:hypothetical protein